MYVCLAQALLNNTSTDTDNTTVETTFQGCQLIIKKFSPFLHFP
jgi:hypothetical protein